MVSNTNQTRFVTAMSLDGYKEYGKRFIDSFMKYANGYSLIVYGRKSLPELPDEIELRYKDSIREFDQLLSEFKRDPILCGTQEHPQKKWKDKEKLFGYSYRFDASKFCRMVVVMHHAARSLAKMDGVKYMIWLDGDTVVRQDIPKDIVEKALNGKDYAYLGRPGKYTETGFLVFDIERCMPILDKWVKYYTEGWYAFEKEWHSAWLFDRAREAYPDIVGHNLTPNGRGHVIHQCWVGKIFDHLKGNRKRAGRSREAR